MRCDHLVGKGKYIRAMHSNPATGEGVAGAPARRHRLIP